VAGATRLLVIRHAQTAWNAAARIQGHQDIELDATGHRQAQRLGQALAHEDLQQIYSSDLLRALQTARALQHSTAAPLATDAGLRERAFGEFEGLSFVQIEQRWPEQAARWQRREADFAPGGGEALIDFRWRVLAALDRLALAHRGQGIALVTHGGVLDVLYRHAAGLPLQAPRHWVVANAGINRMLHSQGGLVLVGWADVAHLEIARDDV
jgi:probable phosphoglycerate mutase